MVAGRHREVAVAHLGSLYAREFIEDCKKAITIDGIMHPVWPGNSGREPKPGLCYNFASSNYIEPAVHPTLSDSYSILFHLKITDATGTRLLAKTTFGAAVTPLSYFRLTDSTLGLYGNSGYEYGLTDLDDGNWHEIEAQYDHVADKQRIYVDGILELEIDGRTSSNSPTHFSTGTIGGSDTAGCKMYDLRAFNKILSSDEKTKFFKGLAIGGEVLWYTGQEGDGIKAIDLTGNKHHGTISTASLSTFHALDTGVKYSFANRFGFIDESQSINWFDMVEFAREQGDMDESTNWFSIETLLDSGNASYNLDEVSRVFRFDVDIETTGYTWGKLRFGNVGKPTALLASSVGTTINFSFEYRGNVDFRRGASGWEYGVLTPTDSWQKFTGTMTLNSNGEVNHTFNFYTYDSGSYIPCPAGKWLEFRNLKISTPKYVYLLDSESNPVRLHGYTPAQGYSWENEFKWRSKRIYKGAAPFNAKIVDAHSVSCAYNVSIGTYSFQNLLGWASAPNTGNGAMASFHFKSTDVSKGGYVAIWAFAAGAWLDYLGHTGGSNNLRLRDTQTTNWVEGSIDVFDGVWHLIVQAYDASTQNQYLIVDGVLDIICGGSTGSTSGLSAFRFGEVWNAMRFDVANLRIINEFTSVEEIQALPDEGIELKNSCNYASVPMQEGDGDKCYVIEHLAPGKSNSPTLGYALIGNYTNNSYLTDKRGEVQDKFSWNAKIGFNDVSGVKLPAKLNNPYEDVLGNPITPNFGRKWPDGVETKIQINPNNAPELIQLGFDNTHLEDFADPLPANLSKTSNNEFVIK